MPKRKYKLEFDDVLERICNDQQVRAEGVSQRALKRVIWVASNGSPGCLNDNSCICTTRTDAVSFIRGYFDNSDVGAPRGMLSALRRDGLFNDNGYIYRVEKMTLKDVL